MNDQTKSSGKVMSDRLRTFFFLRIKELVGLLFIFGAICLGIVLLSASALDPAPHVSSDSEIKNWFGPLGAILSNQLVSWFGLFAVLFPVSLFVWGLRVFAHRGVSLWVWRLILLPLSIQLLSAGFYGLGIDLKGVSSLLYQRLLPIMGSQIDQLGFDTEQFLSIFLLVLGFVFYVWSTALGKRELGWVYKLVLFIFIEIPD